MLSRLAAQSRALCAPMRTVSIRASSSAVPPGREILVVPEGPERDLKNFPRLKMPEFPGKTRLGFLPEEWFTAFYTKTGVSGPYLLGTGIVITLYSKEIMIMDHEFYAGLTLALMVIYANKKFGKKFAAYLDAELDADEAALVKGRNDRLAALKDNIKDEELAQWQTEASRMILDAKRENIALQLESAFRKRQSHVHSEVKRRLDYQLEQVNIQRRLQQKNMVDWIVTNVLKSITPQQEKAMLASCISDLKGLAAARA